MTGEAEKPGPPAPLSSEQRDWIARANEAVDRDFLLETLGSAVEIPSRTGEERALAEFFVEAMNGRGIDAFYQPIDKRRGNSIGRLAGSGGGAELLFYGHLDTTFSADPREDAQMTGGRRRPDLEPRLHREGDLLYGLGVQNPRAAWSAPSPRSTRRCGRAFRSRAGRASASPPGESTRGRSRA